MIRNILAGVGFLAVATAGAAGVYAHRPAGLYDRPERIAVGTAGLDLTSPYGRWQLRRRVGAAIERVCESHGAGLSFGRDDERDCRRRSRAGADPQIARAIERAFDRRHADDELPVAPDSYGAAPGDDDSPATDDYPARYPPEADYGAPPVRYVQRIDASMRASDGIAPRAVGETRTTITRTALKPRVSWIATGHGRVKKTVSRNLVRKTVTTVKAACAR